MYLFLFLARYTSILITKYISIYVLQLAIKLQLSVSTEKTNFNVKSAKSLLSHVTVNFKSPKAQGCGIWKSTLHSFRTASMVYWALWLSLH